MATQKGSKSIDQDALRSLCWELGKRFPEQPRQQTIAFAPVHPRLGYICWNVRDEAVQALKARKGRAFDGARFVVRVYDVTDVIFDGFNAHRFFDIDIRDLRGKHYLHFDHLERNLIAEIGFVLIDGSFCALARSNSVYFDRDRPSSRLHLRGLYVDRAFKRVVPLENVLDAPAFERLHAELPHGAADEGPLHIAVLHLGGGDPLGRMLDELLQRSVPFAVTHRRFGAPSAATEPAALLLSALGDASELAEQVMSAHRKQPFDLIHAHDWMAIPAALKAKERLGLPLVVSLHSIEQERACGRELSGPFLEIHRWEERGAAGAEVVVVPHSSTRQQLILFSGVQEERVLIIGDVLSSEQPDMPDPAAEKRKLGFADGHQVGLFAGEMSHAAGADLLADAVIHVCREFHNARFVLAGDGPLKGEVEGRIHHAGLGHCVRFLGDIPSGFFEAVLLASDYVVIPGRTWQDEGLAQQAIAHGKPVLTTHQAHIGCIVHGENGLVTYDNPGSIIWGVKEMLANPLTGNMMRIAARQRSGGFSIEGAAAEHVLAWRTAVLLGPRPGATDSLPSEPAPPLESTTAAPDPARAGQRAKPRGAAEPDKRSTGETLLNNEAKPAPGRQAAEEDDNA